MVNELENYWFEIASGAVRIAPERERNTDESLTASRGVPVRQAKALNCDLEFDQRTGIAAAPAGHCPHGARSGIHSVSRNDTARALERAARLQLPDLAVACAAPTTNRWA